MSLQSTMKVSLSVRLSATTKKAQHMHELRDRTHRILIIVSCYWLEGEGEKLNQDNSSRKHPCAPLEDPPPPIPNLFLSRLFPVCASNYFVILIFVC